MLAPINQVPPEVLTLVPDFWNEDVRDRAMMALAHVCQAWRELFISRTSLWTDFYCEDTVGTHASFDCSGASPINTWLERCKGPSPHDQDPPLQVIPHAIARLKSVVIHGRPKNIQEVTAQLSHPAPLLESLRIEVDGLHHPGDGPVMPTTLFDGDFSSLHDLYLQGIRTELPWRNMVNLTSFALVYQALGGTSIKWLLDFLESTPRLRKIQLATLTLSGHSGRLVSLPCLRRMDIIGGESPGHLFDNLLIPIGAKLTTQGDPRHSTYLPNSFKEIRALTGFRVHLHVRGNYPRIQISGQTGEINIIPVTSRATVISDTCRVLESLAKFDPSKTERLRLAGGDLFLQEGRTVYQLLLPMTGLRTITISRCRNPSQLFWLLGNTELCTKLEEIVLDARDGEKLDIQRVIEVVAKRAGMGAKLKSVRIASRDKFVQACALKLKEYVPHVECSPRVALVSDAVDSDDEED